MHQFMRPLVAVVMSGLVSVSLASAQSTDPRPLNPGVPIARERSGQTPHEYAIDLEAGQFTVISVRQSHARAGISIHDPAGATILDMYVPDVSILAETAGRYRVGVIAPAGDYTIAVEPPRVGDARDRARARAERAAGEGRRLVLQSTVSSRSAALTQFERAHALFLEAERRVGQGFAQLWIGQLTADRRIARDRFNEALTMARTIGERVLEAEALMSLGASFSGPAEAANGLELLEQAVALFESNDDWRGLAVALTWTGSAFNDLREYEQAIEHTGRALALATAAGDLAQAARAANNLGVYHKNLGELPTALEFHQRAVQLGRAGGALRLEFMAINNSGIVYKELGDYRRARVAYEQSLGLIRKLGEIENEANSLNNIGNTYRAEGQTAIALDYYGQALAAVRRLGRKNGEAMVLNNMGAAYFQDGRYQTALEHHQQSRAIRKALGDRRGESSSLNHEGVAWHKLENLQKALECLRESLAMRREMNDPIGEAETLMNLAAVERDLGEDATARVTIEAALEKVEHLRARISDAGLRATYVARVQETYGAYVDTLMRLHLRAPTGGYDAAALQAAERSRARVLLESLVEARADIREGVDQALLDRERALNRRLENASQQLSRTLAGKSTGVEIAAARKALEKLSSERQQLEAQIRKASPRYAALTHPEPLTASEIQKEVLDADTVLLEIALGEKRSWLWAVTSDTLETRELPARRRLEAQARLLYDALTARQPRKGDTPAAYRARVAEAERRLPGHASEMSRMLFSDITAQLRSAWRGKRLVIVAPGALEYLPFAALPLPDAAASPSGRAATPFVARHEIVRAPSASVVATLRREAGRRQRPPRGLAVIADPVFDAEDPRVTKAGAAVTSDAATRGMTDAGVEQDLSYETLRAVERMDEARGSGLARLPFSRAEANAIEALAGTRDILRATDFDASRPRVLSTALEDYRLVHFATHGLIDAERPELSGLVLSLVDDRGKPQNGFLPLHDIFNMRLNAELVVLSACQTALGKEIKGEGLVGLTRGFMYAGAPRVVASLWQVSDLATAELMKHFYAAMLQRRLPPAAALRAAQLQLARDRRWASPYFWAGFVLQGDWAAISP
jgi:CHAT domain-containing protein